MMKRTTGRFAAICALSRALYATGLVALSLAGCLMAAESALSVLTEAQKLTASDGVAGDLFGRSVAISGNTLVVGSFWDDVSGNVNQGSVYVFEQYGNQWVAQAKLTASDGRSGLGAALGGPLFGVSVALSGNTLVVGSITDDIAGNVDQGSAYVFERIGGQWVEQAKLTASDGAGGDFFGFSVALSGHNIVVGAWSDDVSGKTDQGSAYVFERNGNQWVEQAKLTASDGAAADNFGFGVAVNGATIVIGAPGADIGPNANRGAAYIFERQANKWLERGKLTASDGAAGDNFGNSVALGASALVVGAPLDDIGTNLDEGSAYIFQRHENSWVEQARLTPSDGAAGDRFSNLALAVSGDKVLVGAAGDDIGSNLNQGSAYVFRRQGNLWLEHVKLTASDGAAGDNFGFSVALSGNTAVAGANLDDISTNVDQGSAYVFDLN